MKILEHGTYFGKFEVKCPVCGCIYEVDGPEELIFDSTVRVRCPECEAFDNFKLQDSNDDKKVTEM